ncbi:MAG: hypothetical protein ABI972_00965, partial [Acidobacteriota bacterium]
RMSCFIASNQNRVYGALESAFGTAATVDGSDRLPLSAFRLRQLRVISNRNDKTGSRTYPGAPSNGRESAALQVGCYLTEWDTETGYPPLHDLMQSVTGGAVRVCAANVVQAITGGQTISTVQPHGLSSGQGISSGGEIRFVDAILDSSTVALNAPFAGPIEIGQAVGRTVTYTLGDDLKSLTAYDYWDPQSAVQRAVAGVVFNELRVNINGDYHEMAFSGEGRTFFDSSTFVGGIAGLTEYPPEPIVDQYSVSLIPGTLGQAWIGSTASQSYNVLLGAVRMSNNIDYRRREFGPSVAGCVAGGIRDIRVDLRLSANSSSDMSALFSASRTREPIPIMFQLGESMGQLCGLYLKSVVPEVPSFEDTQTKLEWMIRDARAQGNHNDELSIAFA